MIARSSVRNNLLTVCALLQVFHCRLAMLGAAGCFAPEFLSLNGIAPNTLGADGIVWFKTGVFPRAGDSYHYWTDNVGAFAFILCSSPCMPFQP